jgi:hypothetical protein
VGRQAVVRKAPLAERRDDGMWKVGALADFEVEVIAACDVLSATTRLLRASSGSRTDESQPSVRLSAIIIVRKGRGPWAVQARSLKSTLLLSS